MSSAHPKSVRIGFVQMACSDDTEQNLARAIDLIHRAADERADVVCLPELFRSRYFCKTEDHAQFELAEAIPGPTTGTLEHVARERNVTLIASLFEKRAEGLYHNTAAVIRPDTGYAGKYRKMHIPDDPLFYEKFYFAPGDLGFKAFDTPKARIGTLVCWDQWYPEAARLTALRGASILFYPTAIGWIPEDRGTDQGAAQQAMWETIQKSHAVANGCYVCAVNRIGFEPTPGTPEDGDEGIVFWGRSFLVAPDGQVIARASEDAEEVLVAELDLSALNTQRTQWPFLRDRRIDAYGQLERRFIDEE